MNSGSIVSTVKIKYSLILTTLLTGHTSLHVNGKPLPFERITHALSSTPILLQS